MTGYSRLSWIPCFVAIPGLLTGCSSGGPAPGNQQPPTESAAAARAARVGEDLVAPPSISSKNGELRATLTAAPASISVAGHTFTSNVYNGGYLAPVLRARRGDMVRLDLVNETGAAAIGLRGPEFTNLHYHGTEIPPNQPADDIFIRVRPASQSHAGHATNRFEYRWQVPVDHPLGLLWYHPHVHGLVEDQVLSGLSGLLIIDGMLETHYPELAAAPERLLVLKDVVLPGAADTAPKTKTINGQAQPVIRIRPGEWQFWRVGNIGADAFFDLAVEGHTLVELGHDGNVLERPARAASVFLPPASRSDLMVQGGAPGTYAIRSRAVNTGPQGDPNPDVLLGTLVVEGPPADGSAMAARLRQPAKDYFTLTQTADKLRNAKITRKRTVVFSESADGNTFYIDGKTYDEGRVDTEVRLGDIEEWTIVNTTGERHVFHIHQLDFLVTSMQGQVLDYEGLRDVIDVPEEKKGVPGEVKLIIPFTNPVMVGKFVYHCHILEHEDHGMMANIVVLPRR